MRGHVARGDAQHDVRILSGQDGGSGRQRNAVVAVDNEDGDEACNQPKQSTTRREAEGSPQAPIGIETLQPPGRKAKTLDVPQ